MNILDRYIARQYLINMAVLLALVATFVVMVDLSLNLDKFAGAAATMSAGEHGGTAASGTGGMVRRAVITVFLVADLWWPRLLQLFNFIAPLVVVAGMGFTFAQLVRHREVVAMLAGGVSLYRAARPVLAVAVVATLVQVANQELVLPRIAPLLTRSAASAGEREVDSFSVALVADGKRRLFQAARFDPGTKTLERLNVWERDESGRAVRRISADSATFDESAGGWWLTGGRVVGLSVKSANAAGGGGTGASPNTPGRRAGAAIDRIETDLDPTTLLADQFKAFSQTLSWAQISRVLGTSGLKPDVRERLERVAWGRVSALVCGLLSLVISMRFFLTREPRNMVLQSLRCAPVAIVSIMAGVLGSALPVPGLPTVVAVFLPVLVLVPLAIEAATAIKT